MKFRPRSRMLSQLVTVLSLLITVPCGPFTASGQSAKKTARSAKRTPATTQRAAARSASPPAKTHKGRQSPVAVTEMRNGRRKVVSGRPAAAVSLRNQARPLGRRARAAELQRQRIEEARRRAEAARLAAIARQRAIDAAMRNEVQSMIARDDSKGEDEQVRRVAINALGNHAGTVVVMDPRTGRVYAIVNQEWGLRRGFKPCSTIKLVTGVAGLNEKVIDPLEMTNTSSTGHLNLTDALAYSNNTYFQQVGGRVGFDKMMSYARQFGLGQKTGINSPNEFAGAVPLFKSGFAVNHMSSHGDSFQVTALQLATLVSALANGGKLLTPYVPHNSQEESKLKSHVRRQLDIDPSTLTRMIPGMVGSVNYGSGKRAYNPQETVAGKTGTCIGDGGWVGLFTSYAPLNNPRLAVVVIARGTDAHGHLPAAVAGQIYRELSSRFGTPTNLQIATQQDLDTRGDRTDPKAALDEESTEANDEGNSKVRRVLMPMPSGNPRYVRPITDLKASPKPALPPGQRPRRVETNRP